MFPAVIAAFVLLVVVYAVGLSRQTELFVLRVREGSVRLVRGRVPVALLSDFKDVLRGAQDAQVRAVLSDGRPRLDARGSLSPEQQQRLRNVLGRFTTAQIRTLPGARR